jgi:ABC-type Fe3+/spermidine/putrescine transport system ATPase subunit
VTGGDTHSLGTVMPTVELADIRKSYGPVEVLHGVSLSIERGQFVALLGPSGCGKTTLLRIIAGLESVTAGRVTLSGRDVTRLPPEKRNIAMMFQSYALLPHLSVAENVRFPLRMRRLGSRAEQDAKVAAALDLVQLGPLAGRMPRQLSGGQQQRVALARAVVSDPDVLLLDEPLSNLDARLREDMQVELLQLHRRLGITTIFVTHDQEEALSLADTVVLMRAGRIEQQAGPSEIYAHPATAFASTFIGSANLVPVTVALEDGAPVATWSDGNAALRLPVAEGEAGAGTLMLRQEDLILVHAGAATEPALAGEVVARVFLGAGCRTLVRVGGQVLKCLTADDPGLGEGTAVAVSVRPGRGRLVAP